MGRLLAGVLALIVALEGTPGVAASGRPAVADAAVFREWRGVTAFALLDQLAEGREREAVAFLAWARERGFNVVRVLGMAHHLFRLSPSDGVEALPRLLRLAAAHGVTVELVVFADTRAFRLDLDAHVERVARAVAGARNLVIELANENDHSTQDPRLTDPVRLRALGDRLPAGIPVSLGSLHGGDLRVERYGGGDYVTVHPGRSGSVWRHVGLTATLGELAARIGKPIVNDEPIGADERFARSRRSNDPAVFFGLGLLGRMSGVPTTFHCEDCLRARRPGPTQDACATAFVEGWRLLPAGARFSLLPAGEGGKTAPGGLRVLRSAAAPGAESIHVAADASGEWIVVAALGASPRLALPWAAGWTGAAIASKPGIAVFRARRSPAVPPTGYDVGSVR